ncbi:MAG: hypothetical protein NZ888_06405 [Candidatus Nitrosocaldus sp.]|nr:hypothetical protein [Candidatus Nitrosocaldus sp.]
MSGEVYNRIEAAGIYGVRRVDLRREFGEDVDRHVEELISSGLIFSDKKSGAITYWTKDNYIRYVAENDPKFRLIQVMIRSLDETGRGGGKYADVDGAVEERIVGRVTGIIDGKVADLSRYIDERVSALIERYSNIDKSMMQEISNVRGEFESRLSMLKRAMEESVSSTTNDINQRIADVRNEFNASTGQMEAKVNSLLMDVERRIADRDGALAKEIQGVKDAIDESISSIKQEMDARLNDLHLDMERRVSSLREDLSSRIVRIDESIHEELARIRGEVGEKISALSDEIRAMGSMLEEVKVIASRSNGNGHADGRDRDRDSNGHGNGSSATVGSRAITLEQFRMDFDRMLAEASSSIGWVELISIRERMCRKYDITAHEFYSLVAQLMERFSNRYELSSGGQEGIVIRGLVHGFVRRI